MRRRKLMIGLGALTAGGSAAFGTEAFTSVEAERNVDVTIAGDKSAFVAIQALGGANAKKYVATETDDTVEINLDGDSSGSVDGVSQDAITQIEDLFRIVNQGSQSSSIYFEDGSDAVTFRVTRSTNTSTTGSNGESLEGADNSVELDVGEQVVVGMTVDTLTNDVSGQLLDSVTLFADSGASAPGQNIAQPQYIVTNSASAANEFSEIQAAVDAAESGAVIGIEGSFAPSPTTQITVDTADVTLTGFEGTPTIDLTGASPSGTSAGAIQVTANGVTLRNFNIDYEADANGIEANAPGSTDITIDGMRVKNTVTPSEQPAINLERAESVTVTNNEVLGAAIGTFFEDTNQNTSTISNNFVDLNPGEEGNATNPTEGIFAFGSGVPNTELEIRNNEVVDNPADEEEIKVLDSPSSVNNVSTTDSQVESLLVENSVNTVQVSGDFGTKVSEQTNAFETLQAAINRAGSNDADSAGLTLVESGTFNEQIEITGGDGFALKSANGVTPVIEAVDQAITVRNVNDSDIQIQGLKIEQTGSNPGRPALFLTDGDITVSGTEVVGFDTQVGFDGFGDDPGKIVFEDNVFRNPTGPGVAIGQTEPFSSGSELIITGNTFIDTAQSIDLNPDIAIDELLTPEKSDTVTDAIKTTIGNNTFKDLTGDDYAAQNFETGDIYDSDGNTK